MVGRVGTATPTISSLLQRSLNSQIWGNNIDFTAYKPHLRENLQCRERPAASHPAIPDRPCWFQVLQPWSYDVSWLSYAFLTCRTVAVGSSAYQWPQIEGKAMHLPTPCDILATSYSESSGGKYRSVFPGSTSVLALMPFIANLKSFL